MIAYTVHAEFDDEAMQRRWVEWLRDDHLAEVCASGATDAEAVVLDPTVQGGRTLLRAEARYHFASREAFAVYEREHAPRLRAESLRRFPVEKGVRYKRSVGEVTASHKKK